MKRSLSSKSMKYSMREQNTYVNNDVENDVLQQLCNPNSVNIQQLQDNLLNFGQVLAQKFIIGKGKFKQLQHVIFKKMKVYEQLTEQQTVNLLKWELIFQFFSYCIRVTTQLVNNTEKNIVSHSMKKQKLQEIYSSQIKQCLNEFKQKTFLKSSKAMSNKNIVSKNVLKYISFQIISCILELKSILSINENNDQQQQEDANNQEESNCQKVFYFIDIGEVLEITKLWTQIQNQFKTQITIEKLPYPVSNKNLLKYLYFGLIIESLEFQSASSSLRFSGELLWFLLNDIQLAKSQLETFKNQFSLISHLNKVIYFLRILKKNHPGSALFHGNSQDHVSNSQSASINSQSVLQSKRSLLSKGLGSSNKIQIINPSQKSLQTNNIDEENVFLNLLQEKTQKFIYKFTNKYKDLSQKLNQINTLYEPLNHMLTTKISSGAGSQHHTNYSLNSFKKFRSVKFSDNQKQNFFRIMSKHLKNLFKKMQFRHLQMFQKARSIFIQTENNEKLQSKLDSQQNKNFKTQLMKQFNKHLIENLQHHQSQSKFSGQNKQKSFSQVIKKQNQNSKNVYFPSLKPKMNIQIENRLKLKQIRTSQIKQLKSQSFFSANEGKKQPKKQQNSQILRNDIMKGPVIRSKKNIYNSSQSLHKIKDKKSMSLPSKVKISANYDIKSRFDKINFYESTKNSIMNRKFSYQMIVCKRKKSTQKLQNLFQNDHLLMRNNQHTNQKQRSNIKKDIMPEPKIVEKMDSLKLQKVDMRNSRRRQSLVLKSSTSLNKLGLNQRDFIVEQKNQPSGFKPNSTLKKSKQSSSEENVFVKCINKIVQSYKDSNKPNSQKRSLKLENRVSLNKRNKNSYQDDFRINQIQQFNMSTLKFEDASQILTSLQVYLRGYLQYQRHNSLVKKDFPFYLQLEKMNAYKQTQESLAFFDLGFKVKRQDFIKKKLEREKQNYWSVFRLYLEINQKTYVIDIDQKSLLLQKVTFKDCLKREIQNKSKIYEFSSLNKFKKDYQYYMLGDLGGKLEHYIIKVISNDTKQIIQRKFQDSFKKSKQKNEQNLFLQSYYQNPNLSQIIGIKRQKNTVDIVQLYVTQPFMFKTQLKPIPHFVKTLLFDPLNQYIIDWANDSIPKAQQIYQQMDRTVKAYQKRDRKICHIYFLNRSYQKRSKFKDVIKSKQQKYPSFSYKQFRNTANFLSQEERDFSDCVEIIEFISKNLIINRKYVFFNIKVLRISDEKDHKDYLMIEQKYSNFSDHRLIFFVFPLMIKNLTHKIKTLKDKKLSIENNQFIQDIQRRYFKALINKIRKESSLNNLSRFLINKKMIEISDWPDTIFNKLLLVHPHVTIIKKAYFQNQEILQELQIAEGIKQKNRNQIQRRAYIFATIKVFIMNNNNLVIGVIQISGQSFFFNCLFEQLNKKTTRFKCNPLSRNGFEKRRTQQSQKNVKKSQKFDQSIKALDNKLKSKVSGRLKLSIKKILAQEEEQSPINNKTPKKLFSTMRLLNKQNIKMTGQQKMSEIKQKFISIFKYDAELSVRLNPNKLKENEQKRMTMDNYQSFYELSLCLNGEQVRLTQTKYYWWDVVPQTSQKCVNFRLKDDSLSLIKLSKQHFYMRKSNKVKIHYFQNYLKLVSQNKLKYKGNAMHYIVRNQDKLIYYDSYKQFVQNLQKYHYTFSSNYLLNQIRLSSKNNIYQVNTIDIHIDPNPGLSNSRKQSKSQHKSTHNFQLDTSNLCSVHVENLVLDKKLLNNERFKKRLRSNLDHQLETFLRRQG